MNLIDKVKWILSGSPCLHETKKLIQWIEDDTPMITEICLDCQKILDCWHVHGDTEDWEKVWIIKNDHQEYHRLTNQDLHLARSAYDRRKF